MPHAEQFDRMSSDRQRVQIMHLPPEMLVPTGPIVPPTEFANPKDLGGKSFVPACALYV
ncbi:hypothetical protein RESH_02989 [Rhodopirellula europaea SH398]|uniref:Uncharacterized protein n=1 Tax=Rhodopirellula europaea SH398 TaxID=1263868 RepID=M5SJU6_9BACT|nr:hypothetical protein RESH_02989 [Rhodopirellula europaea SH398]